MALQLTLVGTAAESASEASLETRRPVTGSELAILLAEATGQGRWFLGPLPLQQVARLPRNGHLLLCTTTMALPRAAMPAPAPDARVLYLVVVEGPDPGHRLPLLRGEHTIGRSGADLCVADPALSRKHARVRVDALGVRVFDQDSGNGVTVDGRGVNEAVLVEGRGFNAGASRFLVMGAQARPVPVDRTWPQEPLVLSVAPPSGRILPQALGAILPMAVGIGLFVATGSWYFLAFCAIGLATGGVSAVTGVREKRRYRRAVTASVVLDEERLRLLAPPVGAVTQAFRADPGRLIGPADRVLCVGRWDTRARLATGSLLRGAEPPLVHDVPCFLPWRSGCLGVVEGPADAAHALVRSLLLRLAPELLGGACTLVVVGPAPFLPVELRRIPGVELLEVLPEHVNCSRPVLLLVIDADAAQCLGAKTLVSGTQGPGVILVCPRAAAPSATWCVNAGTGSLLHGRDTSGIRPDRLGFEVLGELLGGSLQEPGFGPLPTGPLPAPVTGADSGVGLACRIGSEGSRPIELDLVADGPHLLIAGTTGSGKSELLRTLVLGWCHEYAATDLALMLIDFKGGAALGSLGGLPQVQAAITDLDGDGAARALESLGAELRRRENLLAAAGASDYLGYRAQGKVGDGLLPRLVVVVDEFRVLGNELPDATERLVRLATIGRSLGVHLVLATQRPQGAVPAELRANINSVLCLRLQSEYESSELLGSPDAARLDPASPGSALLRRGSGQLERFRVDSRSIADVRPRLLVYGSRLGKPRTFTLSTPQGGQAAEELIREAGARFSPADLPVNPFPRPLPRSLPALPRRVLGTVPQHTVGLGLVDLVAEQQSTGWCWSPAAMGRLAVVGHPASGIGPLLENLVAGLPGIGTRAFVVDGAGLLPGWAAAPAVAGYVGVAEPERIDDVMGLLEDATTEEPLVLVVTGLADWAAVMDAQAFAEFDAFLAAQARRSRGPGAALVLVGDRDIVMSKAYPLCEHRLFLPLGSGPETTIGWPRLRAVAQRPGRGVWVGPRTPATGRAVQLLTASPSPPRMPPGAGMQRRYPCALPLPLRVSFAELPEAIRDAHPEPGRYLLGVRGPDNRPVFWVPGSVGLVLGRQGSGKSSLLRLLESRRGPECRVFRLGEPAERPGIDDVPGPGAAAGVILIDDADRDPARATRLMEQAASRGLPVIITARPSASLGYLLPLGQLLRSGDPVLLLGPVGRAVSDQLGFRAPDLPGDVPGRAAVQLDGKVFRIQCLLPPGDPA